MMLYRQFYLTDHINREYGCRTLYENDTAYKPLIYHFDGYYLDLQNLQVKLTENVGKIIFRPCQKEGYALYRTVRVVDRISLGGVGRKRENNY